MSTLDQMLRREEHNLRMDEIRQRMEQEQDLFMLKREKLEVELARERALLEISQHQLSKLTDTVTIHQDSGEIIFAKD